MSNINGYKVDWDRIIKEINVIYKDQSKVFKDKEIRKLLEATGATKIIYSKSKIKTPKRDNNLSKYDIFFLNTQVSLTKEMRKMLVNYYHLPKKEAKKYYLGSLPTAPYSSNCICWARCERNKKRRILSCNCC